MELSLNLLSDNFIKTKKITKDTPFKIFEIDAKGLLCPERLDLAAKIAYIEAREHGKDMTFAKELYKKHIEAFSEGDYAEPGDHYKTSLERFFSIFDELIDDFKINGFNAEKSLIPVGNNNIILDGAHRTACAIYFNKKVSVVQFPQFEVSFDYRYFRKRRLSEEMLNYMAVVYSRYTLRNLYFACLWPISTESKRHEAVEMIRKKNRIIFDANVNLNKNGLRNFMLQIYQQQAWIGTVENHFSGVMGKVDACFAPGVCVKAILFEGGELDEILQMKGEIRDIFKIGKHAIHISDSNEEAQLMAELLFNENSRHALNYGNPDKFYMEMEKFKETEVYFSDFATTKYYGIETNESLISDVCCYEMNNPRTYFVFMGMKLPALIEVKSRFKQEDETVYKMIKEILRVSGENISLRRNMEDIKTKFIWKLKKIELRCKQIAMKITQKIGIYELLHNLYHRERM